MTTPVAPGQLVHRIGLYDKPCSNCHELAVIITMVFQAAGNPVILTPVNNQQQAGDRMVVGAQGKVAYTFCINCARREKWTPGGADWNRECLGYLAQDAFEGVNDAFASPVRPD